MNRRPFLRTFTLAACGLFVPQIVRAVPPPLLDRTLRRKASNDALNVGLVGAWTLAAGNGLTDWSGHGNNGTGQGTGFTLGGASNHLGQAGRATQFVAASSQTVSIPSNAIFTPQGSSASISVALWVKPTTVSTVQTLISKDKFSVTASRSWSLSQLIGGGLQWFVTQDSGGVVSMLINPTTGVIPQGIYTHIVAIYNGLTDIGSVYINGIPDPTTATQALTNIYLNSAALVIGANGNAPSTNFSNNSSSDIRIYNRALPPSQIQSLMLSALLKDPTFAREFWAQNPNHFLRAAWEERMAA